VIERESRRIHSHKDFDIRGNFVACWNNRGTHNRKGLFMSLAFMIMCPFLFFKRHKRGVQMSFNLSDIDKKATRNAVHKELEKYRMYLLMDPEDNEQKITSQLKLVVTGPTNRFYSTTEDTAITRIEQEKKREEFITMIQRAVNRLDIQERSVIINRYLTEDDTYDYEVYNDLGYSERKYYRIKSKAFYKLALILGIEVYKEVEKERA
jgi:ArpU family phage transcriptional regulator